MAEGTNDFPMTEKEEEQKPPQANGDSKTSADMWQEFVEGTTLHGIRYVFMKRHVLIRLVWLVLLLTLGGYFLFTVYSAFNKYYSRPINTVLSSKNLKEMEFPAVTICSLSMLSRRKIFMTDDDPLFSSSGLNISSCAVTSGVRGNRPCGLSLLCCCTTVSDYANLPNCTTQYRQDLLAAIQESGHGVDTEEIYWYYSQDKEDIVGSVCTFGRKERECSTEDFVTMVTPLGMCYTFNSGTDGKVKTLDTPGVSYGFSVILDAQTHDYFIGSFSLGFKVVVHAQGEYIYPWGGTNVGPGQHAVIALSQKRLENLEKPYATNCSKKSLKTFSIYTSEGCLYECVAESAVKTCECRVAGYKGHLGIPACTSYEDFACFEKIIESLDYEVCDCQVPCAETKYHTEVSYSKFPNAFYANYLISRGYYPNIQYQRDNLVFLQIGFKSLSYEMQEQHPAYDFISLFGEMGGNMGLFLGCSLLTIFEFFDFLVRFLAARKSKIIHPA